MTTNPPSPLSVARQTCDLPPGAGSGSRGACEGNARLCTSSGPLDSHAGVADVLRVSRVEDATPTPAPTRDAAASREDAESLAALLHQFKQLIEDPLLPLLDPKVGV
jgi:hypothetical protein